MKKMFAFLSVLLFAGGLLTTEAKAATCGGEPWTVGRMLAGACTGAGATVLPGDNSEDPFKNQRPVTSMPTAPTEPGVEEPGEGGEDPGTDPGDNGGSDNGGSDNGGSDNGGGDTGGGSDNGGGGEEGPGSGGPSAE